MSQSGSCEHTDQDGGFYLAFNFSGVALRLNLKKKDVAGFAA